MLHLQSYQQLHILNDVRNIRNLGELIDTFDLSTAYKQGESIGTKVGQLPIDSLGFELGLMPGDVIKQVNGIKADDTQNRFDIYKKILSMEEDDTIEVEILRKNNFIEIVYKLKNLYKQIPKKSLPTQVRTEIQKLDEDKVEAEKIRIMHRKYKFAPTVQEIKLKEKQNMLKAENKKIGKQKI